MECLETDDSKPPILHNTNEAQSKECADPVAKPTAITNNDIKQEEDKAKCSNVSADNGNTMPKHRRPTKRKRKNKSNAWDVEDAEYDMEVKKVKQSFLKGKIRKKRNTKGNEKDMFKGPFIQIRGDLHDPKCETIVNKVGSNNSKENNKRSNKSTPLAKADINHKQLKTPSANRWDASQIDHTWVCVFCGKRHSMSGLGDLFGPYVVNASATPIVVPTNVNEVPADGPRKDSLKYLKRTECVASTGLNKKAKTKAQMNVLALNSDQSEVWVHQDCLIWSDGVFWVPGDTIRGLQEAVLHAAQMKCSFCSCTGANVGCIGRGCNKQYHYLCARDRGCLLDHDSFTIYCPKHRLMSEKTI